MTYRVEVKVTSSFSESWFPVYGDRETIVAATEHAIKALEAVPEVKEYRIVEVETGKVVHPMNPSHVEWCANLFASLRDGGVWGIPRSGLMFTRKGDKLVLTAQLPYYSLMPIVEAQLEEQQTSDFEETKKHFAAAGITVLREGE